MHDRMIVVLEGGGDGVDDVGIVMIAKVKAVASESKV
jgi:hypothetical protein